MLIGPTNSDISEAERSVAEKMGEIYCEWTPPLYFSWKKLSGALFSKKKLTQTYKPLITYLFPYKTPNNNPLQREHTHKTKTQYKLAKPNLLFSTD